MFQVRQEKEQLVGKVRALGGSVVERDEWDPRVTHVVARVDGKKESMSEKVSKKESLMVRRTSAGDGCPGRRQVGPYQEIR